jgi:trigger factor
LNLSGSPKPAGLEDVMKATLARSEGYERTLEITIETEVVRQSYDKVLNRYARDIAVPGFRKGKAPRHMAA